jgi:hypothetical protein
MESSLNRLTNQQLNELIRRKSLQEANPQVSRSPVTAKRDISPAESFFRGAADTVSLGFMPKILGGILAPALKYGRPDLFGDQSLSDIYKQARDDVRQENTQAMEQNLLTNLGGSLAGAVALPFPAKNLKEAAALGAGYGALQGLGESDFGDVGEFGGEDILSGLTGAGIGAATGGLGHILSNKLFSRFKAPAPEALDKIRIAQETGIPLTQGEITRAPETLLKEERVLSGKVGASNQRNLEDFKNQQKSKINEAASNLRNQLGQEEFVNRGSAANEAIGNIQQQALDERKKYSQLYQEAKKGVANFNTNELKGFMQQAVSDFEEAALSEDNVPKAFRELQALDRVLNKEEVSLNSLEAWKQGLNRAIKDASPGGQEEFALKQLSQKFDGYLDGAIETALTEGNVDTLNQFKNARKLAANWFEKYSAKSPDEVGKKFVEDIVDNARFSREPFTDEMLVNKIFGASELGFKPAAAGIVKEIKKLSSPEDFNKIKLEAAQKLLTPLLGENPSAAKYTSSIKKFLESNNTLARELFSPQELKQFQDLGEISSAVLTREKSLANPSGTASVIIDYLQHKPAFGFLKNVFNKVELDQEKIAQAVRKGEKLELPMNASAKALILGGQSGFLKSIQDREQRLQNMSDADLERIISIKQNQSSPKAQQKAFGSKSLSENQTSPKSNKTSELIPDNLLNKIAYIESGGDPNAKSATSSASGMFQFTNATWKEGVKKYGKQHNISMKDKNNPEAQKIIAMSMLEDATQDLSQDLGRKLNEGEIYLIHFLGPTGARKLLNNYDQQTPAARLLPAAAKSNRSIFFAKGKPRTTKQVYDLIQQKMDNANYNV